MAIKAKKFLNAVYNLLARSMRPSAKRRKLNTSAVEEVTFDPAARFDYLTGFHKRKVQRTKQAQEAAAQKARQEKIEERKRLREERKADLERHVKEVNALLPSRVTDAGETSDEAEQEDANEPWDGIEDVSVEPIDHEAEYIDEDKYTTVTVEEVDISRDGISKIRDRDDDDDDAAAAEAVADEASKSNGTASKKPSGKPKDKDKVKKVKKKKKAFRYESPADRKLNRAKERAKKSKQARARRGS